MKPRADASPGQRRLRGGVDGRAHRLPATSETVRIGVIDRAHEPVLSVSSGDEVVFETLGLWGGAVTRDSTMADVLQLRERYAGGGPHSITGPVEIKGAQPGQTLRIDILDLQIADYGVNLSPPAGMSRGLLAERFPEGYLTHFALDTRTMTTQLADGVCVALRPFLGIMGVAPAQAGPHNSVVPGVFGGNIDCPDLVAGTRLFLPIFVEGARFYVGDAHAAQGYGEVNQTAIETAMSAARLRLSVVDEPRLERPRAETADHVITFGVDTDLRAAATQAIGDMVALLEAERGLSAEQAYTLCSIAVDLAVTQVVNHAQGVHARLPKKIFGSV